MGPEAKQGFINVCNGGKVFVIIFLINLYGGMNMKIKIGILTLAACFAAVGLTACAGSKVQNAADGSAASQVRPKPIASFEPAVQFSFNGAVLAKKDTDQIKAIAQKIKALNYKSVTVRGHTDNVGSEEAKKNVSMQRAKVVADILTAQGVTNVKAVAPADGEPVASNDTEAGRAKNRRADVFVWDF